MRTRSRAPGPTSALRLTPRTIEVNVHASRVFGPDGSSGRLIHVANPSDRWDHDTARWIFAFGGFSWHGAEYILAWGDDLESALEAAAEYALERWPALDAAESIRECYEEILRERGLVDADLDDEQRWEICEEAEIDTMTVDGCGTRMHSEDVHIVAENPTRADLEDLAYPGGAEDWRGEDTFTVRRPVYRPTRRDYDPTFHERAARAEWEDARTTIRVAALHAARDGAISRAGFDRIDAALHGERFTIGTATF